MIWYNGKTLNVILTFLCHHLLSFSFCSKNKETGYVCELCFNENKQITATHFCKTCNDPEPLCEACAKEHIRQKISKDHSLSDEIEDFHQSKANVWYIYIYV